MPVRVQLEVHALSSQLLYFLGLHHVQQAAGSEIVVVNSHHTRQVSGDLIFFLPAETSFLCHSDQLPHDLLSPSFRTKIELVV